MLGLTPFLGLKQSKACVYKRLREEESVKKGRLGRNGGVTERKGGGEIKKEVKRKYKEQLEKDDRRLEKKKKAKMEKGREKKT